MIDPATGRFQKGNVPWNGGMRGIRLSPATEFKAGVLRGMAARAWVPIGTIAVRRKPPVKCRKSRRPKCRWIKVADSGRPYDRWVPYARWLWEQRNGPVPSGYFIIHLDGDSMNDSPGNLAPANHRLAGALGLKRDKAHAALFRSRSRQGVARRWEQHHHKALETPRAAVAATWDCVDCGHGQGEAMERCPKCRSHRIEQVRAARPTGTEG